MQLSGTLYKEARVNFIYDVGMLESGVLVEKMLRYILNNKKNVLKLCIIRIE